MVRITSRRNQICTHIKELGASRRYRESCGQFLCDGIKLLEEAVMCNAEIKTILTSTHLPFPIPVDTKVFCADRSLIDSLSPLKNAQDILFTCVIPTMGDKNVAQGAHILLDGVQDPGNIGAIIRTADAFGICSALLTKECADPYNPKSIRASMGAIFRQKIQYVDMPELLELKNMGTRFIGAAFGKDCRKVYDINYKDAIIVIGNEGRGISGDILLLCGEKITIPITPGCESLNAAVAAAIIMWEAAGRALQDA